MLDRVRMDKITWELERNIYNKEAWYKILKDYYNESCEGEENGD